MAQTQSSNKHTLTPENKNSSLKRLLWVVNPPGLEPGTPTLKEIVAPRPYKSLAYGSPFKGYLLSYRFLPQSHSTTLQVVFSPFQLVVYIAVYTNYAFVINQAGLNNIFILCCIFLNAPQTLTVS